VPDIALVDARLPVGAPNPDRADPLLCGLQFHLTRTCVEHHLCGLHERVLFGLVAKGPPLRILVLAWCEIRSRANTVCLVHTRTMCTVQFLLTLSLTCWAANTAARWSIKPEIFTWAVGATADPTLEFPRRTFRFGQAKRLPGVLLKFSNGTGFAC
jgi:hypothetical protein